MSSAFTVGIDHTAAGLVWHVVCDRCGQELDVVEDPLLVFRIKGMDEISAMNPQAAEAIVDRLQRMRHSPNRMVIMDADHEVQELHMGLGQRLLDHAARCERA